VRWVRDPSGRVPERPHYDPDEIDRECESRVAAFLRRRHGAVRCPLATNDLTILLEQETSDLDLYADLSTEGAAVEGMTEFLPGEKPRVRVARKLSEDPARERRLRTTLAHELGHVWFHTFLWSAPPGTLRAGRPPAYRGCGQATMLHARPTDWMEWQAGYAGGAILMPAGPLRRLVEQAQAGHAFRVTLHTAAGAALLTQLERAFDVSREAARVRLAVAGLLPTSGSAGARRRLPASLVASKRRAPVLGTR
jgi:IrrE N-terminal-like domain